MRLVTQLFAIFVFAGLAEAIPLTVSVSSTNSAIGQSVTFTGRATDSQASLGTMNFYVNGPGMPGWNYVGGKSVSGSDATATFVWSPSVAGSWYVHVRAFDTLGNPDSNGNIMNSFTVYQTNQPPITVSVSAPNATLGSATTFTGRATDPNGNLSFINFYVNGPGMPGWNFVGSNSATGGDATTSILWTAPSAGNWAVHIRAFDTNGAVDSNGNVMGTFSVNAQSYAFKVLVDTNTLTAAEASSSGFSLFSAITDGAYALTGNSSGVNWNSVFQVLHADQYVITEELYHDYMFADPSDWRNRLRAPISADEVQQVLGHRPNNVLLYHEPSIDDPSSAHAYRYPYETILNGNASLSAGDQITAAHNHVGDNIVVLTRAYDYRATGTDVATADTNCTGVLFEMRAPEAGMYNVPQGIAHVLASGKRCYVLMGPSSFTSNTYLTDLQTGMRALRDGGAPLNDPNLYIVVDNYSRPGVTFVGNGSSDPYANQDSVLAASQWLRRFRDRTEN